MFLSATSTTCTRNPRFSRYFRDGVPEGAPETGGNPGQTGRFRCLTAGIAYLLSGAGYPFSVALDSLIYGVWGSATHLHSL